MNKDEIIFYHSPRRATHDMRSIWILLALNSATLLLAVSVFHYPRGADGAFFPLEFELAFALSLATTLFGGVLLIMAFMQKIPGVYVVLTFVLTVAPLPICCFVYDQIYQFKQLNFGPG